MLRGVLGFRTPAQRLSNRGGWSGSEVRMRSGNPGPDRPRVHREGPDLTISLQEACQLAAAGPEGHFFDFFDPGISPPRPELRRFLCFSEIGPSSASICRAARCQCSSCFPCGCPSASQKAWARRSMRSCFSEFIRLSPKLPRSQLKSRRLGPQRSLSSPREGSLPAAGRRP